MSQTTPDLPEPLRPDLVTMISHMHWSPVAPRVGPWGSILDSDGKREIANGPKGDRRKIDLSSRQGLKTCSSIASFEPKDFMHPRPQKSSRRWCNSPKKLPKQQKSRKSQISAWFSRYRVHNSPRFKSLINFTNFPLGSAIHITWRCPLSWAKSKKRVFSISPLFLYANRPSGRGRGRRVLGGRDGVGASYYD